MRAAPTPIPQMVWHSNSTQRQLQFLPPHCHPLGQNSSKLLPKRHVCRQHSLSYTNRIHAARRIQIIEFKHAWHYCKTLKHVAKKHVASGNNDQRLIQQREVHVGVKVRTDLPKGRDSKRLWPWDMWFAALWWICIIPCNEPTPRSLNSLTFPSQVRRVQESTWNTNTSRLIVQITTTHTINNHFRQTSFSNSKHANHLAFDGTDFLVCWQCVNHWNYGIISVSLNRWCEIGWQVCGFIGHNI